VNALSRQLKRPGFWAFALPAVLWGGVVSAAVLIEKPLGVADARTLATGLLHPDAGKYLGFCPMPLVVYFFAAVVMRHPVALVFGAYARSARGDRPRATRALLASCAGWALLSAGGALIVAAARVGGDWAWAREIAFVTALAGLPCMAVATTCGLVAKRAAVFWVGTPLLLAWFMVLAFGLQGDRIPPVLPGRIEVGLTSGQETLRTFAVWGTVGWAAFGSLMALRQSSRLDRLAARSSGSAVERGLGQ
jgi:hypothetical protein